MALGTVALVTLIELSALGRPFDFRPFRFLSSNIEKKWKIV
jgi:hypothetical protein